LENAAVLDEFGQRAYSAYEGRYTPEINFNRLIDIYRSVAASRSQREGVPSTRETDLRARTHW
jgi:hypothetical protein